jgi:hypothetical protein
VRPGPTDLKILCAPLRLRGEIRFWPYHRAAGTQRRHREQNKIHRKLPILHLRRLPLAFESLNFFVPLFDLVAVAGATLAKV